MTMTPFYLASAPGAKAAESHGGTLFEIAGLPIDGFITTTWAIMLLIILLSWVATRRLEKVPRGLQNAMEMLLDGLLNFLGNVMGSKEKARRYLPLLGSFFIFILISNYSGLLPGAGIIPGFNPPTSTWSVTAGLALIVLLSSHYFALREKGLKRYLKHFIEPVFIMLPLNILEELIKPLSLSLRLFGNIFGEELLLAIFIALVPIIVPIPIMFLSLLLGGIQALVFTMLAAIYIAGATADHH